MWVRYGVGEVRKTSGRPQGPVTGRVPDRDVDRTTRSGRLGQMISYTVRRGHKRLTIKEVTKRSQKVLLVLL